ncbi:MAG: branched-chain amino acid transport system II carrier protein [Tissierellales bacterium]|jgi:LIVCS family branched-chain amino acid:cation transporter|nr:branched-chain amino acid transport system II carrier protein [Tissierellales bacterium]
MQKERKDFIVVGAALFAMFFGAGNLIFPPALGLASGNHWFSCFLGFFLTGIVLPVMGVLTVSKIGGSIDVMGNKVGYHFSKVMTLLVVLAIGPLLAIPRTGATVFEIGVQPTFPNVSPILVSIIYFGITLAFVMKPSGIVDKIGKILTPILLVVISTIIIKGIFFPIGTPISTDMAVPFASGFTEGYQTMDALGAVLLGSIVLLALKDKGYKDHKTQLKMATKAGLLAGAGLAFVYGGLLYLGATGSGTFEAGLDKTSLIMAIATSILGSAGQGALSVVVSAACLTTSIGLTAVCGEAFVKLFNNKISYKATVIGTTLFSATMSVIGVEAIVGLAVPILTIVYPLVIILIGMNFFGDKIKNNAFYIGAVAGALPISLIDAFKDMGIFKAIGIEEAYNLTQHLPFAAHGFAWVVPAIVCSVALGLVWNKNKATSDDMAYGFDAAVIGEN